jgi:hypothetical protein
MSTQRLTRGTASVGTMKAGALYIGGTAVSATTISGIDPIKVHNNDAATIAKGNLVYIDGYDTGHSLPSVKKADADFPAKAAQYVVGADILTDAEGLVYREAIISGINTDAAAAVGDPLYLSATEGDFTATAPTGDRMVQVVGTVMVKGAGVLGSARFYPGKNIISKIGASAVQTDGVGIAGMAAGDFFTLYLAEQDFGVATAVATKVTDSAPCALEVISARLTLTEATAGGATDPDTIICKTNIGGNPSTTGAPCVLLDTVYSNKLGTVVGLAGLATADAQYALTNDIYVYTPASVGRSAGKYFVEVLCKKL